MKILYLHGLGSSGQSSTVQGLKAAGLEVVAPDYKPQHFTESLQQLAALVEAEQPDILVGTSMGGYYALKLNERYGLKTLVVNACFDPATLLRHYLQAPAMDYVTNQPILFDQTMLDAFEAVMITGNTCVQPRAIVGTRDDVIDPSAQRQFCRQQGIEWHDVDWGHRVEDIPLLIQQIERVIQLPG